MLTFCHELFNWLVLLASTCGENKTVEPTGLRHWNLPKARTDLMEYLLPLTKEGN